MTPDAPAFPLAGGALAPLRAAAEPAGSDDFMSLWSGQSAALGRALPAAELTRLLAAEASPCSAGRSTEIRRTAKNSLSSRRRSNNVGSAAEEAQHMGQGITFAQQKGGSGKTTVLAHLAAAWAEAGRSVAIIDLDPQQSLTRWARLRADPAIVVLESKDYRAGGDIKAARKAHDIVLVDCPGAASSLLESAIRESDLVLAPCQPSVMDVWALASVLETARKLKRPVRILLNRMPPRLGSLEEVLAALGDARALLLATQLGNRNAFSQAMLTGRTAPEVSPRSTAAAETYGLRAELAALLARL